MLKTTLLKVKEKKPLVFCLTNSVTINDVANLILGLGASPLMAYEKDTVKDIVPLSSGILINLGTPVTQYQSTLMTTCKLANKLNVPIIIDPVGIGCINKHYKVLELILNKYKVSMIKGNAAEIFFIFSKDNKSHGLDSNHNFEIKDIVSACKAVSKKYKTIVLATGPTDVLTDGEEVFLIKNGTEGMTKITGTGCVLGAIMATTMTVTSKLEDLAELVALFSVAGEVSHETHKENYFHMKICMYDFFINHNSATFNKKRRIEKIEKQTR